MRSLTHGRSRIAPARRSPILGVRSARPRPQLAGRRGRGELRPRGELRFPVPATAGLRRPKTLAEIDARGAPHRHGRSRARGPARSPRAHARREGHSCPAEGGGDPLQSFVRALAAHPEEPENQTGGSVRRAVGRRSQRRRSRQLTALDARGLRPKASRKKRDRRRSARRCRSEPPGPLAAARSRRRRWVRRIPG